jgi:hypothetical protein
MKDHKIKAEDLTSYVSSGQFHTFCIEAGKTSKKLQVQIGGILFRVFHGNEVVYEGTSEEMAVGMYNGLYGQPTNPPKYGSDD